MKQKLLSCLLLCTLMVGVAYAQNFQVKGKVSDKNGAALAGVTVISEATAIATQTDNFGNYQINGVKGKKITFRIIGYSDKSIIVGSSAEVNVELENSDVEIERIVVTAYGSQNKEAITGAVASITAKDIEKRPVSSVTTVLEGAHPGLQINNSYGEPGTSPNIRIRGYNSVNGRSNPIYVVDGVIFNGNISDINPSDVESVSVLKDATSASLYGSRGANGVIVISTKKGKAGVANINLIANLGAFSRGIKEYDKLNDRDFMNANWQGYRNQLMTSNPTWSLEKANEAASTGLISSILKTNIYSLPDNELFDANGKLKSEAVIKGTYAEDLDWFKPIIRNGFRQDYSLTGTGGSEKSKYYFSTSYLGEEGYITSSNFDRISGRLSGEVVPKSWIKAGLSVNASHQLNNKTTGAGGAFVNPWLYARTMAPIYPIYQHDPVTGEYVLNASGNKIYDDGALSRKQNVGRHIIWETELNESLQKRNTMSSQAHVEVKFLENFTFTVLGDLNLNYLEDRKYENAIIGDGAGNKGRAFRTMYNYKIYTLQQLLNYSNLLSGVHSIDLMAGHENYGNIFTYLNGSKNTETIAGQNQLVNFSSITTLVDYEHNDKLESYFGRARYNYAEKYFVEGSIRRDGTSRVDKDLRWRNFWSIGGTWMASKENFLTDVSWLNTLKLRVATGVVGSLESLGYYDYMGLYALSQNKNVSALFKSSVANKELTWEGNRSSSFAVEGRLFNRVNITLEYFDKRSEDLIFKKNLALSTGSTYSNGQAYVNVNVGDLINKGFEFSVDPDVVKLENFNWNLGVNGTILKNKIISLPQENRENGIISSPFKFMEGHSVYDYYLRQFAGVDMLTGQSLYFADTEKNDPTDASGAWFAFQQEINGVMYTRNSSYAKQEYSGSGIPKLMGGINTAFTYKNWNLSALFTYSIGGKALDYSYNSLMDVSSTPSAIHKDVKNSWTEAPDGMTETSANRINPDATPQINYANSIYNNAISTRFLINNSYFIVRNVSLAYRMPRTWLKQIGLDQVDLRLSGENLAFFTALKGYSPQQTFGGYSQNEFVPARTISFGVNVGF